MKTRSDKSFDNFFQDAKDSKPNSLQYKLLKQKLSNIARIAVDIVPIPEKIETVDLKKANPITVDAIKLPSRQFPKIDANPYLRIEELPEDLRVKYETIIQPMVKEIAHYHEVAKTASNDTDRKQAINHALLLESNQSEAWAELDNWWTVNKLGEGKESTNDKSIELINPAKEAIALQSRIGDLKTNINRATKELTTLTDKRKVNIRNTNLVSWNAELIEKETRLKALTGE